MPPLPALRGLEIGTPPLPPGRRHGWDVHAFSRPARTFTGDFYLTRRGGGSLWLALGDVAGKGLPAAVFMAMIQEKLEELLDGCASRSLRPAQALRHLNEFLLAQLPANRFATAVVARLSADGALEIANAGHCVPLIRRREGSLQGIAPTGPVLGILADPQWTAVRTRLRATETLLLYSDGLVEAPSGRAEEFGMGRIRSLLAGAAASDARGIAGKMVKAAEEHAGGTRHDDLTVVVAQRPAGPSLLRSGLGRGSAA
ncbi:MAG TPA: PP2C family protein-serine/threonine phosphatase [Candidatus Polarisedimenticolia bacterium]|nr:PP2C family protein-serine/threonine phosphatase [Candidatus Polarisedimenticolia bacterium]